MRTVIHDRLVDSEAPDVTDLLDGSTVDLVPLEGGRGPRGAERRMDYLSEHSFVLALDNEQVVGALAFVSREEAAYVTAIAMREGVDREQVLAAMFDRLDTVLVSEAGRSTLCVGVWSTHREMRDLMARTGFSLFSFDLDCEEEGVDAMIFHRRRGAPQEELAAH